MVHGEWLMTGGVRVGDREIERVGGAETIKVDVRVIAATNRDLENLVELGHFRQDLYFRLNVVGIHLPRLIERRQDIPLLAYHCLEKCKRHSRSL